MDNEKLSGIEHAHLMVVDDEPVNLKLLDKMLGSEGYSRLTMVQDPREVIPLYHEGQFDLILLDINMPHLDGFQVLEQLRNLNDPLLPPIIILTAQHSREYLLRALKEGARDFITKPFDRNELLSRVRNMLEAQLAHRMVHDQKSVLDKLVRERTEELANTRLQIVQRLGRAAEYRDNETGNHILRMSESSTLMARSMGWDDAQCELMLNASPMHDIGKIGIKDSILLKPGKLDPEEFEVMKRHAEIGAEILSGDDSELLQMARTIALTHHEKWDGSGYPNGLAGDEIPLVGRIVAVADVFDALTSQRPYKKPWPIDEAKSYIESQAGSHFDPEVVEHFLKCFDEILVISSRHKDVFDEE